MCSVNVVGASRGMLSFHACSICVRLLTSHHVRRKIGNGSKIGHKTTHNPSIVDLSSVVDVLVLSTSFELYAAVVFQDDEHVD